MVEADEEQDKARSGCSAVGHVADVSLLSVTDKKMSMQLPAS